MDSEIFNIIIKITYEIFIIGIIALSLFLFPYSLKKLRHWIKTENEESLRKGSYFLIISLTLYILFIVLMVKRYF